MPDDEATDHEHELSAEYLYPADAEVLDVYDGDDSRLRVRVAVPCPACSETLSLTAAVDAITESGPDLPLDEDYYD